MRRADSYLQPRTDFRTETSKQSSVYRWIRLTLAGLSLLSYTAILQSQDSRPTLTVGPSYTSSDGKNNPKFPKIDLVFTLVGADGIPKASSAVTPGDLKLSSGGKDLGAATSIRAFKDTGYGVTAILALDASGSMRGAPISAIHASIAKFVDQARPQDRVAVATFADDVRFDVPFGSKPEEMKQKLQTVQARGTHTILYGGLIEAMGNFTPNQPKRRQLVVISDGHDEDPTHQHTLTEVVTTAKNLGVVIDSIGLTRDHGEYLPSLQKMSEETGGTYRRAQSAQQLEALIGQGIQATQDTTVATFKVSNLASDGNLHSTQLRWQPGNVNATAFIKTPKMSSFGSLWVWGLAACFFAGLVLLAVSWFGSRRKPLPMAASAAPWSGGPSGSPFGNSPPPLPSEQGWLQQQSAIPRAPTVPDFVPDPGPGPGIASSTYPGPLFPRNPETPAAPNPPENRTPAMQRGRTQVAGFFEAHSSGPYARLDVKSSDLAGKVIPVTRVDFTIGAVSGNDLILSGDPTVSGRHARLLWENSILKIEDINSTNGVSLNSVRLGPGRHVLKPGDEIRLGRVSIIVHSV